MASKQKACWAGQYLEKSQKNSWYTQCKMMIVSTILCDGVWCWSDATLYAWTIYGSRSEYSQLQQTRGLQIQCQQPVSLQHSTSTDGCCSNDVTKLSSPSGPTCFIHYFRSGLVLNRPLFRPLFSAEYAYAYTACLSDSDIRSCIMAYSLFTVSCIHKMSSNLSIFAWTSSIHLSRASSLNCNELSVLSVT